MAEPGYEIGMIGLGVMGRNLALNIADRGFSVVGTDKESGKVQALRSEAKGRRVQGADDLKGFIDSLRRPRAVMMLVPAGPPVDTVIRELIPHLEAGDLIIDGGNSYFKETDRRASALSERGILFLGVGISGGEQGARRGPSIMPGGPKEGYDRVRPIFEAAAAKVEGTPCVAWLGPGSAGHYVKMVHNGIEYGLMQLIAESYDVMKRGLGLTNDALADLFDQWNRTELNAYLIEITARIFRRIDEKTGQRLIDLIRDEAKEKGTGKWTAQDAMELQVPVPTIDIAVAMRDLSAFKDQREAAAKRLGGPPRRFQGDRNAFLDRMREALYAAMLLTYVQGMAQLRSASDAYDYNLNLTEVARIWRGGCIIRAALLEEIRAAYRDHPDLPHLLLEDRFAQEAASRQEPLRAVVQQAAASGIPVPGFMVSLAYFDGYRSERLPANLIQAQRDYFGAHTYERTDEAGVFHTAWDEESGGADVG
ncbi:MAG: NADP-dependent phosphogluconate dehydrogenase [Candidatus Manganitrophaceae bacterium]|nr:MAG: NADP-dependent phosphogluconate dehydrogenase [Candidatus Manganitrophaceae bacterium]